MTTKANEAKTTKQAEAAQAIYAVEKKVKKLPVNIQIDAVQLSGSYIIEEGTENEQRLDLADIPAETIAELVAYGLGRHAPDSSGGVNSDGMRLQYGKYFEAYQAGFISPAKQEKAQRAAEKAAAKPATSGNRVSSVNNRPAFCAWLDTQGHDQLVNKLEGASNEVFWVIFTGERTEQNAGFQDLYTQYKEEKEAEAKEAADKLKAETGDLLAELSQFVPAH